jgi:AcrR family transcriptional regulator
MDRVLKALETLLDEKPFERITMIELAQRSGTGTSSIYARFKDKNTLVLGVHARLQERAFPCLEKLTDMQRWQGKPIGTSVWESIVSVVKFYREHGQIVRTALLVDRPIVYERQVQVLQFASGHFAAALAAMMPSADAKALDRAVDGSVRLVSAVMHQSLIFRNQLITRKAVSDRELVRQLTTAVCALLRVEPPQFPMSVKQ